MWCVVMSRADIFDGKIGPFSTKIGIIGAGNMGLQLQECFIEHHYPVILKTRDLASEKNIRLKIEKHLKKRNQDIQVEDYFSNLTISDSFESLIDCDLIIECVVEDYQTKYEVLKSLVGIIKESTVVATNTSALSVSRLSDVIPGLAGFHFFNPISRMKLIEIIYGRTTSKQTIDFLKNISESLGKQAIVVSDTPGFLVNRLLLPQINNAIKMVEAGVASKEGIDSAIKLGLNHPMGPFELADFIGLDVCYNILNEMYEVSNDLNYRPANMLKELVLSGRLGFKSGSGFYHYPRL